MAGGLTYQLTAQSSQFNSAMQQSTINVNHFHTSTRRAADGAQALNRATRETGAVSGGAARGILELSRGVEDAAVGFGTNGLAGAIRGSLNNITQFAYMMGGPVAGAIAGFTAAGVSLWSSFSKTGEEAKKATKEVDQFARVMSDLARMEKLAIRRGFEGPAFDTAAGAQTEITKRANELEQLNISQRLKRAAIADIAKPMLGELFSDAELQQMLGNFSVDDIMSGIQDRKPQKDEEKRLEKIRELEKQIGDEQGRRRLINEEINQLLEDRQKLEEDEMAAGKQRNEEEDAARRGAKREQERKAEEERRAKKETALSSILSDMQGNRRASSLVDAPLAGSKEAFNILHQAQQSQASPGEKEIAAAIDRLTKKAGTQERHLADIKKLFRDNFDFEQFEVA